jgi:hypothetical protein
VGVVAGPTTTLAQVKVEAAAKAAAVPAGIVVSPDEPMIVEPKASQVVVLATDAMLRAEMPLSGPMPLDYEDVLDISMYSAQEISDDKDALASFDEVNRSYNLQVRTVSRRQMAATWETWA